MPSGQKFLLNSNPQCANLCPATLRPLWRNLAIAAIECARMSPIIFEHDFVAIARKIPMRNGSKSSDSPRHAQHHTAEYWTSATKNEIRPKVPECKPRRSKDLSRPAENALLQNL